MKDGPQGSPEGKSKSRLSNQGVGPALKACEARCHDLIREHLDHVHLIEESLKKQDYLKGTAFVSDKELAIPPGVATFGGLGIEWTTLVFKYHDEKAWFHEQNLMRLKACGRKGCTKPISLQMLGVHKTHLLPRAVAVPLLCQFIAARVTTTHKGRCDDILQMVQGVGFIDIDWEVAGSYKLEFEADEDQHATSCVHTYGGLRVSNYFRNNMDANWLIICL